MRHPRILAGLSRATAALLAGSLASTALLPTAAAQGKAAPAKPPADAAAAPKPPDKKTKDAARKAYAEGEKAYNSGDYAGAQEAFTKAHGLIPTPHAEFWIAMSLANQGKDEEATKALEALLASPESAKIGDDKLAEAKKKLGELQAKQGGEISIVSTPAGAQVTVDGQAQMGETPMTVKLKPGPHKIAVTAAGYETKQLDVDVKAGEKSEQKVDLASSDMLPPAEPVAAPLPPAEPSPTPPPAQVEKKSKVPAYITLGVAGAGAIVGTFFGIKALGAKSDFEDRPTNEGADDVERNALIADMAFGVAITLGVTGIVLLTSSDGDTKESVSRNLPKRAKLNVAPYVSPQGGGAAARWTF